MGLLLRAKIKPEHVGDVESEVKKMFAAIEDARPSGVRYSSSKLADGATFLVQLELENEAANPLPSLPAFRQFQDQLKGWIAEPPAPEQYTVIAAYRSY